MNEISFDEYVQKVLDLTAKELGVDPVALDNRWTRKTALARRLAAHIVRERVRCTLVQIAVAMGLVDRAADNFRVAAMTTLLSQDEELRERRRRICARLDEDGSAPATSPEPGAATTESSESSMPEPVPGDTLGIGISTQPGISMYNAKGALTRRELLAQENRFRAAMLAAGYEPTESVECAR